MKHEEKELLKKYDGKPCALCNRYLKSFVVFGVFPGDNQIAICEECADNNWISNYKK